MGGFSIKNESLTGSVRRSREFRAHVRRSRARRRYGLRVALAVMAACNVWLERERSI